MEIDASVSSLFLFFVPNSFSKEYYLLYIFSFPKNLTRLQFNGIGRLNYYDSIMKLAI